MPRGRRCSRTGRGRPMGCPIVHDVPVTTTDTDTTGPLSPTDRSTPRREKERAQTDRATLYDVLDASWSATSASWSTACRWRCPRCSPSTPTARTRAARSTCTARSPPAAWCRAPDQDVSVTVTVLDGLVLARSGFNHSMNYRSAVVIGRPRVGRGRRGERPRPRPARRPRHARPVGDAAPADPQGARRHRGARAAAARGVGQAPHRRPGDEDDDVEAGGVWPASCRLRATRLRRRPRPTPTAPPWPDHVLRRVSAR